jgi:hypothetical protein
LVISVKTAVDKAALTPIFYFVAKLRGIQLLEFAFQDSRSQNFHGKPNTVLLCKTWLMQSMGEECIRSLCGCLFLIHANPT